MCNKYSIIQLMKIHYEGCQTPWSLAEQGYPKGQKSRYEPEKKEETSHSDE